MGLLGGATYLHFRKLSYVTSTNTISVASTVYVKESPFTVGCFRIVLSPLVIVIIVALRVSIVTSLSEIPTSLHVYE